MLTTRAYAVHSATTSAVPFQFTYRDPRAQEVALDIQFCGICHSDIHQARNEWGGSLYPMVPGHEIVGTVRAVGAEVTKFKVGDWAAVGVMVDSCRVCAACKDGEEQYCEGTGTVATYNSRDKQGNLTFGGYADHIVVDQAYALSLPKKLDPAAAAPLLCAGITTYSPLKHWKAGPGTKVGIVGLGGLGHLGLKFAHAFGAHVVQFTTSAAKAEDALRLGADEVVLTKEEGWEAKHKRSFDFILDCVSAKPRREHLSWPVEEGRSDVFRRYSRGSGIHSHLCGNGA
ncbi:NAD(P)-dependent alcohol dehydrogenase [Acidisarcina polymorpha]|uniref:NAD(P)-dependent alcohol dehydrogenase n=1 Tax=Acidisarcina polymorpha TaxID=2211140 RepID=UPI0026785393